jgi:hypothetical protein
VLLDLWPNTDDAAPAPASGLPLPWFKFVPGLGIVAALRREHAIAQDDEEFLLTQGG